MRLLVGLISLALAGCYGDLELDGRPCPCAQGWTCCESQQVCVREPAQCNPSSALAVTPETARLRLGASQRFSANVGVSWSVEEADGGSIDSEGVYRAPLRPGVYHVRATSDRNEVAAVTVTVGPQELQLVAGRPGGPGHADGFGSDVRFRYPTKVTADQTHVYVSDGESVRRMKRETGEVTTLVRELPDGQSAGALALSGGRLYVASAGAQGYRSKVFRVDPESGALGLVAGGADWQDGVGSAAGFAYILDMVADGSGALYFTDNDYLIRKLIPETGKVSTVSASEWALSQKKLPAAFATSAAGPYGRVGPLTFHDGALYVAETWSESPSTPAIWKVDTSSGAFEQARDRNGTPAQGGNVSGLCFDELSSPLVLERNALVTAASKFARAGSMELSGDVDATAGSARFAGPTGVWYAGKETSATADDVMFLADNGNFKLRQIQYSSWLVSSVAGESSHHGKDTGIGSAARLTWPRRIAANADGVLFVAEQQGRIRRIEPGGATSFAGQAAGDIEGMTVVEETVLVTSTWGTGQGIHLMNASSGGWSGVTCDDSATPHHYFGLAYDGGDYVYATEHESGSVIRLDATKATSGSCLTGVLARARTTLKAGFDEPRELAVDAEHQLLFVSDEQGVHQLDLATGGLSALASPAGGWGVIAGLAYDPAGVLYVLQQDSHQVRALIVASGTIYDLVGAPGHEGVKLGALPGGMNGPAAIALLPDGALAIADAHENSVLMAR